MTDEGQPQNLAEALPVEINRVRGVQDEFKAMRGMRDVIVEPQIAMMEQSIQLGISAAAAGDVIAMLCAYEDLKGWQL